MVIVGMLTVTNSIPISRVRRMIRCRDDRLRRYLALHRRCHRGLSQTLELHL